MKKFFAVLAVVTVVFGGLSLTVAQAAQFPAQQTYEGANS
jgi:hypothetical protein